MNTPTNLVLRTGGFTTLICSIIAAPSLADAAAPRSSPTPNAAPSPAPNQPQAQPPAPPSSSTPAAPSAIIPAWLAPFIGTWSGPAETVSGEGVGLTFTSELTIQPTDQPHRFTYTMVYKGPQGAQTRPYFLIVKDAAAGLYEIDEGNGIILAGAHIGGTLYEQFAVAGSRITTSMSVQAAGTTGESLVINMLTTAEDKQTTTGGKDGVPPVSVWPPVNVQRSTLKRTGPATGNAAQPPAPAQAASPGASTSGDKPTARPTLATERWTKLTTKPYKGKQDDIYFVNPQLGWYCNGAGLLFRTTDGGQTWNEQLSKPGTYFRCVAFIDDKLGFAGNIGPDYFPGVTDTTPLYRTEDGGATWAPATISGAPIVGLCAIDVLRTPFINAGKLDSKVTLHAGGRVGGPAAILTSTDLGKTWTSSDLSAVTAMVLDIKFIDEKRGFIAGATNTDVSKSSALILATTDGGTTWKEVYRSTRPYELTWKLSFPSDTVGYCTIQSYNPDTSVSARVVAKTANGGQSWVELPLVDDHKVRQFGIAFADEQTGWVGATPGGFVTHDGGLTWQRTAMGNAVNKLRIVRDEQNPGDGYVVYGIGVEIHKLDLRNAAEKNP